MPKSLNRTEQLHTREERKADKAERRKIRRSAWYDEDLRELPICKGVTIDHSVYEIKENRYITLIIKGLVVYLITAGGLGSFLSAMQINFSALIFHTVILVTAILCATLYHSWRSENLGYLVFFSVYAVTLILFRDYINSGFYAILNDINDYASIYFRTDGLTHYNERIANRYAAITVAVTLIGIAANILLNNYILRRARYMIAIFLGVTINLVPLYMEREPELIYSLMLIAGIAMTYVLKSGRHFTLSRNDHIFKRRKWGLSYGLDHRSLLQGVLLTLGLVVVMANIVNFVRPREDYRAYRVENEYKAVTREYMQNLIMLGFAGLWNFYPNNGGLSSGELGGVSSIRLDYQPDIKITFTPYSTDTLYIKNLSGQTYIPFVNRWKQSEEFTLAEEQNLYEAEALKQAYEQGKKGSARGIMKIANVEAAPQTYHPYYTSDEPGILYRGYTNEYVYYPLLNDELLKEEGIPIDPLYLEVPEDNLGAVGALAYDAGLTPGIDPEVAAMRLANYYESNIPYTIRPGATPRGEDFVNYFLSKNRKGYCAHFASAATLALRSIGIPARYCEGYAVSYRQIMDNGSLEENGAELYHDYYDGYNALGETGLISVNATDANAHAWVEIYVDGKGWIIADVTPSISIDDDTDDDGGSFWDFFNNMFGDGDVNNAVEGDGGGGEFNVALGSDTLKVIAYVLIGIVAAAFLVFLIRHFMPQLKYHIAYASGGLSDKLVLYFGHRLYRKRRDKELAAKVNYREQLECLYDRRRKAGAADSAVMSYTEPVDMDGRRVDSATLEQLIEVMERAGFSSDPISEEEFRLSMERIRELFHKAGKG
ncbi:MAG: transglutaminase domain-containing protein [Eubacterium sp.]|nr:transglutaminase domain-containing protein [Eubacterium sp.]